MVITRNAWDDTNSIGNTMSNFFRDQEDIEIANLYFRAAKPDNAVCKRYYHVTESEVLKHYFSPSKCGRAFAYHSPGEKKISSSNEKKLVSVIRRFSVKPAYALSDHLWDSKKWINERLKRFIDDFQPDVVFTFAKSLPQYYQAIRFLHEEYRVKIALWIGDDEYSSLKESNKKKDKERIERLRYILGCAAAVWGCSEEICAYYNRVFGCDAVPLYKSCTFDHPVHNGLNRPLRVMYAGNLLFGRPAVLKKVIDSLKEENAMLEIYSGTPVSSSELRELDIPGTSAFMGSRAHDEIRALASQADLVLHIESFEDEEILKTRYSFSTKIIDCLESGSVLLAIGPKEIASIRYIKKIPGAFVIDDVKDIPSGIAAVMADSASLPQRASQIRAFAVEHHSRNGEWLKNALK